MSFNDHNYDTALDIQPTEYYM